LEVDRDLDNPRFNIIGMQFWNGEKEVKTMVFSFNAKEVKYIYTAHEQFDMQPDYVEVVFEDGNILKVYFHGVVDPFKYPYKLINEVFKMKMLGTKWEEENPDKYI
jgi:hypothetical protein